MVLVERALARRPCVSWFDHGSGIIIIIACGSERPASTSSSSVLSNIAESMPFGLMIGRIFCDVVAERRRLEQRLARVHPVDVAAQRVDLAVVRDVAVRVRAVPARERVGGEARVHQRDARSPSAGSAGRGNTGRAARWSACPCRRACLCDRLTTYQYSAPPMRRGADLVVGALADHVELALERRARRRSSGLRPMNTWRMNGSQDLAVSPSIELSVGTRAPAEHLLAFGLHDLLEALLRSCGAASRCAAGR